MPPPSCHGPGASCSGSAQPRTVRKRATRCCAVAAWCWTWGGQLMKPPGCSERAAWTRGECRAVPCASHRLQPTANSQRGASRARMGAVGAAHHPNHSPHAHVRPAVCHGGCCSSFLPLCSAARAAAAARLPLSGSEPRYDDRDARWWSYAEGAEHGAYAWALQDYR